MSLLSRSQKVNCFHCFSVCLGLFSWGTWVVYLQWPTSEVVANMERCGIKVGGFLYRSNSLTMSKPRLCGSFLYKWAERVRSRKASALRPVTQEDIFPSSWQAPLPLKKLTLPFTHGVHFEWSLSETILQKCAVRTISCQLWLSWNRFQNRSLRPSQLSALPSPCPQHCCCDSIVCRFRYKNILFLILVAFHLRLLEARVPVELTSTQLWVFLIIILDLKIPVFNFFMYGLQIFLCAGSGTLTRLASGLKRPSFPAWVLCA